MVEHLDGPESLLLHRFYHKSPDLWTPELRIAETSSALEHKSQSKVWPRHGKPGLPHLHGDTGWGSHSCYWEDCCISTEINCHKQTYPGV